jgi:hypothetical protein
VNSDDLQLLVDFRSEVPAPDEASAERIYRLATTSRVVRRRPFGLPVVPQLAGRKRLIALSAAAAAAFSLVGVLIAVTLSAAPASAYAAARKAIAGSSAGALDSGTMTLNSGGPYSSPSDGNTSMVATVRWNGDDIAIASGTAGCVLPGFDQLLLVGGGVYLQRPDGSWLHYASEADLEPPLYAGAVQAARSLAAGSRAAQIIASAYGLQRTVQPDGSTVYSGTIPPSNPAEVAPSDDTAQIMLPSFGPGGAFQLVVGSDGLVRQISETASPPLTGAWSIEYSQLGSTPPITPPSTYTEGTSGDLPAPPTEAAPAETGPCPAPATVPTETGP